MEAFIRDVCTLVQRAGVPAGGPLPGTAEVVDVLKRWAAELGELGARPMSASFYSLSLAASLLLQLLSPLRICQRLLTRLLLLHSGL